MMHRHVIAAAVLVLAAACTQESGTVYQLPIAEARSILVKTGFPPLVFGSQTPDWQVSGGANSDVVWIARRGGAEIFRYIASLKAEGQSATRVSVELKGTTTGPAGNTAQKLADNPAIKNLYVVAITERIASALERRPFEMAKIYPALAAASIANMGSIRASADQAAEASNRLGSDNIKRAYRNEAAGFKW